MREKKRIREERGERRDERGERREDPSHLGCGFDASRGTQHTRSGHIVWRGPSAPRGIG